MTYKVLSTQSHVVHGFVGNSVATFAMQRLGIEVGALNTVQFSNHTGYDSWRGSVYEKEHINNLVLGLQESHLLYDYDAILSGYVGNIEVGRSITNTVSLLKKHNKNKIYCCDPVMGDTPKGFFVNSEVVEYMKNEAIQIADIITPNLYEAAVLTDIKIETLEDLKKAAQKLYSLGPKIILITSVILSSINCIENVVFDGENFFSCKTPFIKDYKVPNGCGDLVSSLFLSHYLKYKNPKTALELSISSIYSILCTSDQRISKELLLVANQNFLINPSKLFESHTL